jgi:hypothetical protein
MRLLQRSLTPLFLLTILLAATACASSAAAGTPISAREVESPLTVTPSPQPRSADCPITRPIQDQPPKDPNADPFGFTGWFINADRTLWAGPVEDSFPWRAGDNKVIWIRPQGTQLTIDGRRLDADTPPLKTWIPDGYTTGFQVTNMAFPTEGCWEITAESGKSELRFVVKVAPADTSESNAPPTDVFLVRPEGAKGSLIAYDTRSGQQRFTLPAGMLSADGQHFYLAATDRANHATLLDEYDPNTGSFQQRFHFKGEWALSGVSPSGRWAALTRLPGENENQAWTKANQWQTDIQIVEGETGKTAHLLSLDGNFEVETISADGQSLFLVQHLPAVNPDHYLIRLYDLSAEQLQADPLRAKGADEVMAGLAWDGIASPDGHWLLTLYLNTRRDVAFVHTLDLQNKFPVCIDLPSGNGDLNRLKYYNLALAPDGQTLYATNAVLGSVAEVDLNTRQVVRTVEFTPAASAKTTDYAPQAPTSHSVVSKDGRAIYFTSGTGIWVYDVRRGQVNGPYGIDAQILGLGLSRDGAQVYVAGADGRTIAVGASSIKNMKITQ